MWKEQPYQKKYKWQENLSKEIKDIMNQMEIWELIKTIPKHKAKSKDSTAE